MDQDVVVRVEWKDIWYEYRKRNIKYEEQFKFYTKYGMVALSNLIEEIT